MNFQHQFQQHPQQGEGQQQPQLGELMMDQNGQLVVVHQMQPQGMQPMAMPFSFDYVTIPAGMVYSNMQPVMPPPPPPRVDHSAQVNPTMLATPYMTSAMDSVRKVMPPVIPPPVKPSMASSAGGGGGGDKPSMSPQSKKPKAEKKEKDSSSSPSKSSSKVPKQSSSTGKSKSGDASQQASGATTAAVAAASKPSKPKKRPAANTDKDEKKTADSGVDSAKSSPTKSPTKKRRKPAAGDKSADVPSSSNDKASVSVLDKENGPFSSDEPEAFGKLDCMNLVDKSRFEKYITFLPCVLGRDDPSMNANKSEDNSAQKATATASGDSANSVKKREEFISLGNSRTIGRRHAQINFNYTTGFYEITIFGSNKALVRGEIVKCTEGVEEGKTVPLYPGDPVKIGDVGFYFCMPELERPKKIFAELTVEALETAKRQGIMQQTAKGIAEYIISKPEYAYYNVLYGNEKAILTLIRSIQNAISKSDKIVSSSKDKAGKALYSIGTKVVPGKKEKGEKQSTEAKQASSSGAEQNIKKEGASSAATMEKSNNNASTNVVSMQVESSQPKEVSSSQSQDEKMNEE